MEISDFKTYILVFRSWATIMKVNTSIYIYTTYRIIFFSFSDVWFKWDGVLCNRLIGITFLIPCTVITNKYVMNKVINMLWINTLLCLFNFNNNTWHSMLLLCSFFTYSSCLSVPLWQIFHFYALFVFFVFFLFRHLNSFRIQICRLWGISQCKHLTI